MKRFAQRSQLPELIDAPGIPFEDWTTCLRELNTVNTYLGGHDITIEAMNQLLPRNLKECTVVEIGCGGGDNLKAIARWNRPKKLNIHYRGIDINEACTEFAEQNCRDIGDIQFTCSDYRDVALEKQESDILFNSLFCHHFTDDQLVDMLQWMKRNSRLGFFINDLQRHPLAYYSIRLLTRLFSKSYLVKNDGPVSVLRGFTREEWQTILRRAGINRYQIKWKWAFRYLIVVPNE